MHDIVGAADTCKNSRHIFLQLQSSIARGGLPVLVPNYRYAYHSILISREPTKRNITIDASHYIYLNLRDYLRTKNGTSHEPTDLDKKEHRQTK